MDETATAVAVLSAVVAAYLGQAEIIKRDPHKQRLLFERTDL